MVIDSVFAMAEATHKPVASAVLFVIIVLHNQLTLGYESVYDILERRNPSGRIFETSQHYYNRYQNGDRYLTHNKRPTSIYSSIRPNDQSSKDSFFGNGYDNLGNGRWGLNNRRFETFRTRLDYRRPQDFGVDAPRGLDYDRRNRNEKGVYIDEPLFRRDDYFSEKQDDRLLKNPDDGNLRFDDVREFAASSIDDLRDDRPLLTRRSEPHFYHRDYFKPKFSKTLNSGFASKNTDENYESTSGERGGTGLSKTDSFIKNNEDKNQKKTDEGFQDRSQGVKSDFLNKEKVGESTRFDKNGGNKSTLRSNRVSKKGHTTKGFATHHHKDETGNTTTFFDESEDNGGQSDFQDLEDEFGSKRVLEMHNGKEDGKFFKENGGKSGRYGSGILRDNQKYEKDILSSDDGFRKEEQFGTGQGVSDRNYKSGGEYLGGGQWDPWY